MSDKTVALTVVLDNIYRVDDVEKIMKAIIMIKGVCDVKANIADCDTYIAYSRAISDLEEKTWKVIKEDNL
jgi:hypothetical protein